MKIVFPGRTKQVSSSNEGLRRGMAGVGSFKQSSSSMNGKADNKLCLLPASGCLTVDFITLSPGTLLAGAVVVSTQVVDTSGSDEAGADEA